MLKNIIIIVGLFIFVGCKEVIKKEQTSQTTSPLNNTLQIAQSIQTEKEASKIIVLDSTIEMNETKNTINEENITYDYVAPNSLNIAKETFDSSFEKKKNYLLDGVEYDYMIKHSGKRSLHFGYDNDTLTIKHIPVQEGKWYIVSGYMYVKSLPADVMRYYVEYMHGDDAIDIPNYPVVGISKAKSWQEFVLPVYIKKDLGIDHIKLTFRDVGEMKASSYASSDVWLDDVTVHEVKDGSCLFGLTKPSQKRSFDGALVKVDSSGNFSLKSDNNLKPFLPIIIYPGGKIEDWKKYKTKGFNTIMCTSLEEARKAVSLGMHWIWSLYDYGIYDGDNNGYKRFVREYQDIKENEKELFDNLLYFYWDNETYLLFDTIKRFSDTIKRMDVNENNMRYRPFMMQLDFSTANSNYVNESFSLVDLQSGYANPMIFEANDPQNYQGVNFKGNYDGEFANFALFDHIPGVKTPKTIFVVNSPFGDKHIENTIFTALARGAKGVAYWKDGGSQPHVETKSWWRDFGTFSEKLQQMLPLIRTSHWTSWKVDSSLKDDEDGLVIGTRDFEKRKCMIYASRSNKEEVVHISTEDVKDDQKIIDYFSHKVVGVWKENAFDMHIPSRGYGVYCW